MMSALQGKGRQDAIPYAPVMEYIFSSANSYGKYQEQATGKMIEIVIILLVLI
jgi:hypothetical protein